MNTISIPAKTSKQGRNCVKVTCGSFERIDATATAAKDELKRAIGQQLRYAFTRTYRQAADGTMFCLYFSDGWCYDIVSAETIERGYPSVAMLESSVTEYEDAQAIVDHHVAAYCDPRKVGAA